jgi:hypothetical protein
MTSAGPFPSPFRLPGQPPPPREPPQRHGHEPAAIVDDAIDAYGAEAAAARLAERLEEATTS